VRGKKEKDYLTENTENTEKIEKNFRAFRVIREIKTNEVSFEKHFK
jgi:hypothetical protein